MSTFFDSESHSTPDGEVVTDEYAEIVDRVVEFSEKRKNPIPIDTIDVYDVGDDIVVYATVDTNDDVFDDTIGFHLSIHKTDVKNEEILLLDASTESILDTISYDIWNKVVNL